MLDFENDEQSPLHLKELEINIPQFFPSPNSESARTALYLNNDQLSPNFEQPTMIDTRKDDEVCFKLREILSILGVESKEESILELVSIVNLKVKSLVDGNEHIQLIKNLRAELSEMRELRRQIGKMYSNLERLTDQQQLQQQVQQLKEEKRILKMQLAHAQNSSETVRKLEKHNKIQIQTDHSRIKSHNPSPSQKSYLAQPRKSIESMINKGFIQNFMKNSLKR